MTDELNMSPTRATCPSARGRLRKQVLKGPKKWGASVNSDKLKRCLFLKSCTMEVLAKATARLAAILVVAAGPYRPAVRSCDVGVRRGI